MTRASRHRLLGQAGFTLAEVITAFAVAGVVSTMATPVASKLLDYHRLSMGGSQLSFEIARARTQAVGQNAFVRLRFTDPQRYVRERSADGVTYVQDGATISLPSGVSAYTFVGGAPAFNRQGVAAASSLIILVSGHQYRIYQTNILGRVQLTL